MSGGATGAQRPLGRPLDGGVRRHGFKATELEEVAFRIEALWKAKKLGHIPEREKLRMHQRYRFKTPKSATAAELRTVPGGVIIRRARVMHLEQQHNQISQEWLKRFVHVA